MLIAVQQRDRVRCDYRVTIVTIEGQCGMEHPKQREHDAVAIRFPVVEGYEVISNPFVPAVVPNQTERWVQAP